MQFIRQWQDIRCALERMGRRMLVRCVSALFRAAPHVVHLPAAPHALRILLVRLDPRVGNMIMLTPLVESLRVRFPHAEIDLLGSPTASALFQDDPRFRAYIPYRKRSLLHRDGPVHVLMRLRQQRYHVALDASNPTDPSVTQALLVRCSGAMHTVGFSHGDFGALYSAPVSNAEFTGTSVDCDGPHEIDLRLRLLDVMPGTQIVRGMRLHADVGAAMLAAEGSIAWQHFCDKLVTDYVTINIGARLIEKRLDVDAYAVLAKQCLAVGCVPVLTYGPNEVELAKQVLRLLPKSVLAPPTDLMQLAYVMRRACAVITCDTGPMHLAVALGTPTCGIFVNTSPSRYGYPAPPHCVIDARRSAVSEHEQEISAWIAQVLRMTR